MTCKLLLGIFLLCLAVPNKADLSISAVKEAYATAKESIDKSLKTITENHVNLRGSNDEFGKFIESAKEDAIAIVKNTTEHMCTAAAAKSAVAAADATACIVGSLVKGVATQVLTQAQCFKMMGEYAISFALFPVELAKCMTNIPCYAEIIAQVLLKELTDSELVKQKLNHIWELQNTILRDIGGCLSQFGTKTSAATEACSKATADAETKADGNNSIESGAEKTDAEESDAEETNAKESNAEEINGVESNAEAAIEKETNAEGSNTVKSKVEEINAVETGAELETAKLGTADLK